jgi:cytochrome P450
LRPLTGQIYAPGRNLFSRWADEPATPKTLNELYADIDVMVAERCWKPTDDLLSYLVRVEADGDELTADKLRKLVSTLLTAGDAGHWPRSGVEVD